MKVIIAGSRHINDYDTVEQAIHSSGPILEKMEEVVCGGAKGVDNIGKSWARRNLVPVKEFHPDWSAFGKGAGPMRNAKMAVYADALIAVWDGKSRGTKNMIDEAFNQGLKIHVVTIQE